MSWNAHAARTFGTTTVRPLATMTIEPRMTLSLAQSGAIFGLRGLDFLEDFARGGSSAGRRGRGDLAAGSAYVVMRLLGGGAASAPTGLRRTCWHKHGRGPTCAGGPRAVSLPVGPSVTPPAPRSKITHPR